MAPLLWGGRPEQQSLCVLRGLALGSPPCVTESASGTEGKPAVNGEAGEGQARGCGSCSIPAPAATGAGAQAGGAHRAQAGSGCTTPLRDGNL